MNAKKIPVIRGSIGDWTYYTGLFSFKDILERVSPINDELHKSKSLNDAIQRSITDNYKSIKEYIINQDERFFNAIVLAIYDGHPNWIEVELEIENESFYNLGFLSLSGEEKIFPVDGQHRVEGIKKALIMRSDLEKENIPVIFIGHKKNDEGMKRTRRLFSTLNRYAKPVSLKDIVALDEDDIIAITTRYLVENHSLFQNENVIFSLQKNIPDSEKKALTSLISLADCVNELGKYYFDFFKNTEKYEEYKEKYYSEDILTFSRFKRFRPSEETLNEFAEFCIQYWNEFSKISDIKNYLSSNDNESALPYRNQNNGGNILFRPIGIFAFVQSSIIIAKSNNWKTLDLINFENVVNSLISNNFNLNEKPWKYVAWDPHTKTINTSGNKKLMKLLFIYFANDSILSDNDLNYIKLNYAKFISYQQKLDDIELKELFE
ncbi:DGQHR domain-containing protein [Aliarcobacter cibarius]|uniref:DGQHR domain-containing protein n=1 Tax=Arcobacteraceae TaxID=2808963 RepID=UPI0010FF480E|nr:DGQHR domain-containing protein [Aliarcobacter cibarius]TLT04593.1 DGQHR domain-containing protein [Aliarcobacter cibarius]